MCVPYLHYIIPLIYIISFILYLLFPFNDLWAHFHDVRRLMTHFHWSLFCACSFWKFRLASSPCIFLLQVFLGLPGGWCHNTPSLSQDILLPPSHHMPEPPQPSHPQHIPQLPHPTPPHSSHDPSTWLHPYTWAFFYHN